MLRMRNRTHCLTAALAWLVVMVAAQTQAWAQSKPDAEPTTDLNPRQTAEGDNRPWAEGVSVDDQAQAEVIFKEGNQHMRDSLFVQAIGKYREALTIWDHPSIHYNLSLALMNLDRPILVYGHLGNAISHGPEPIEQDKYDQALAYRELVLEELAWIEVVCEQEDVRVALDGRQLFVGPGREKVLVRKGEHQVSASREGYFAQNRQITLAAREEAVEVFNLVSVDEVTVSRRRWAPWIPWTLVATGSAIVASGAIFHNQSRTGFGSYDDGFDSACSEGCPVTDISTNLNDELSGAENNQTIAYIAYGVGGVALASGMVMVFLNQPRLYRKEQLQDDGGQPRPLVVAPWASGRDAGVQATLRF